MLHNKPWILFSAVCMCCFFAAGGVQALDLPPGTHPGNQIGEDKRLTGGAATGGVVNINGGTVTAGNVMGGATTNADAYGNSVTFNSGSVTGPAGDGFIAGGFVAGDGHAYQNRVVLNGGSASSGVSGGFAGNNTAYKNEVIVNEGTWGTLGGGQATGDAYDNTVVMNGGAASTIVGGLSMNGVATGNTVTIYAGTVNTIVAGFGAADSHDNTVNLHAGATGIIALGGTVLGGGLPFSGNTLNLYGWTGSGLETLGGFHNYNFLLSATVAAGDTIIKVDGNNAETTDISDSVITVGMQGGSSRLKVDDEVVLIDASKAGLTATGISQGAGATGVSLLYEFDVSTSNDKLIAKVTGTGANPDAESLSLGRASTMAALRQGGDLVADNGIQNLLGIFDLQDSMASRSSSLAYASPAFAAGWSRPAFFTAIGGGHYSLKAGHRTGIDSVSALAGMGWRNRGACGSLFLGAFFELGYADYDSDNVYAAGRASVKGDGDSRYFGGGLLARYDWQSGLYAEASARIGAVKNKFDGSLVGGGGNRAKYDLTGAYYGAHAGLGYQFRPAANSLLDLSLKYLWTRQDSDTATIDGDHVKFKADDSHRLRAGARYSYNVNPCFAPYVGAAFEYEFDGKARAGTSIVDYGVPSLKGGTGIGELGFTYRKNAFTADLGIQGHVGKREALTGTLRVGWAF